MKNKYGENGVVIAVVVTAILAVLCVSGYSRVCRVIYINSSFKLCAMDFILFDVCNKAFAGITVPLTSCVFLMRRKDRSYSENYVVRSISREHIADSFIVTALVCTMLWVAVYMIVNGIMGYAVTGRLYNYDVIDSHYFYYTGYVAGKRYIMYMLVKIFIHSVLVIYARIMLCVALMAVLRKNWMVFTGTAVMLFSMPFSMFIRESSGIDWAEKMYLYYSYDRVFISEAALLMAVCVVLCLFTRLFMRKRDFYEEKQ